MEQPQARNHHNHFTRDGVSDIEIPYVGLPMRECVNLCEEGARCKSLLKAFTAGVIAKLAVSPSDAEQVWMYDDAGNDANIYFHFPFCFWEAFPRVALEDLRTIAFSGILWMSYMRAQDDSMDRTRMIDPKVLFLRDTYLRESLHLLYKIFPCDSRFWEFYSTYFDEYSRSVLCEKAEHSSIKSNYEEEEFHLVAKGKAAMAKYPIAAEAVLSGQYEKLPLLTQSLDSFYVGYQYWDDVVDWKEDLANESYSLLLARALEHLRPDLDDLPQAQLQQKLSRVIYFSGLAEDHLRRAFKWFERSHELSVTAGCPLWAANVTRLQDRTVALASDLRSIMAASPDAR